LLALDARVFAVLRETADGRDRMLCLHNVSAERVVVRDESLALKAHHLAAHESCWRQLP
jgi:hypothetical protein